MGDDEGDDDFQHVDKGCFESPRRRPFSSLPLQHWRQLQRDQEEYVIEADPDVPNAIAQIGGEFTQPALSFDQEFLCGALRAQDASCRMSAADKNVQPGRMILPTP